MPLPNRQEAWPTLPHSCPQGYPHLLCCPGEVQSLLFQPQQQMRGRASSPALITSRPPLLPVLGGKMVVVCHLSFTHVATEQTSGRGQFSHTHALSLAPVHLCILPSAGSALLCYPGDVQDPLRLVRGEVSSHDPRASSPTMPRRRAGPVLHCPQTSTCPGQAA